MRALFLTLVVLTSPAHAAVLGEYFYDFGERRYGEPFGLDLALAPGVVSRGSEDVVIFDQTLFEFNRSDRNVSVVVTRDTDPDFTEFASRLTNGIDEWINMHLYWDTDPSDGTYSGQSIDNFWESDIAPGTDFVGYTVTAIEINWFGPLGGAPDGSVVVHGNTVPVPAAIWLFASGLLGLIGVSRHRDRYVQN